MLELNKVYHGDCLDIMKNMKDGSIDMILTDVPYGVDFKGGYDDSKDYVFSNHIKRLSEMRRVLKDTSHCYIFIPSLEIDRRVSGVKEVGFVLKNLLTTRTYTTNRYLKDNFKFDTQIILYLSKGKAKRLNKVDWVKTSESWFNDKRNPNPKEYTYSYPSFIREYFGNQKPNKQTKNSHGNEKNVKLCETLIKLSSFEGDVVLDPFLGSGTTAVAARNTGRDFIGIEKEIKYVEAANNRLG